MFQMVDEERHGTEDRKLFWVKVGLGIMIMAAMVGVGYFFAYVPYHK